MAGFTLDTSGAVGPMPSGYDDPENRRGFWSFPRARYEWSDLSPFEQGATERVLRDAWDAGLRRPDGSAFGFSDLSPEALALIRRDCAAFLSVDRGVYGDNHALSGHAFWAIRNSQTGCPDFPPLTPYLADDGKVHLREGA